MRDPSLALLRTDASFRHYWLGQGASSAGAQVTVFALPLVTVITLDAGPSAVSLVATAATAPYLLFSLLAGHLLAGRAQKRSMIVSDIAQAVLLAQIPLAWAGGWLSVALLAGIAFATGTSALVFGLSAFSYVPSLVAEQDLAAANRSVQGTRTVTEIAGPGIAGLLVAVAGAPGALIVTIAGYLASAAGVATSRPRQRRVVPSAAQRGATTSIFTGLRILFANRYLRALTIHAAAYNAAEQVILLNLIVWAVRGQDVSPSAYGLAMAAAGVGGLIGTLIALALLRRLGLGRAFAVSLVLSCAVPVLLPAWQTTGWALAGVIAAVMLARGIGEGGANVYSLTMRQQVIAPDQLTRSAGAYTQVIYGSLPLGALLAGLAGQTLGPRTAVLLGAIALVLSALPMLTPTFLRLRDTRDARQ